MSDEGAISMGSAVEVAVASIDRLAQGTLVTPNVRLVRLLGRGGMGAVWVAEHLTLQTEVAVKFIVPELVRRSGDVAKRFEREARLAARIKSPHAVQIHDHGITEEGAPYIVMELLDGESLAARLERQGPLALGQVKLLVGQASEVLGRAHDLGIVHRDIKPDNVFCIESGYELFIKILDFGIAKDSAAPAASAMTGTGAMMGTPTYMSPEQVQSARDVGPLADQWALAVTAYEALTGEAPFAGETLGALCIAIATGRYDPPSRLRSELGADLDAWFARAFHRDPKQRFATMRAMATAFRELATPAGRAPSQGATAASAAARLADRQADTLEAAAHAVTAQSPSPASSEEPPSDSPPTRAAEPGTFAGAASTMDPYTPPTASAKGWAVPALAVLLLAAASVAGVWLVGGSAQGQGSSARTDGGAASATEVALPASRPEPAPEPPASASPSVEAGAASATPIAPPSSSVPIAPSSPPSPRPRVTNTPTSSPTTAPVEPSCQGDRAFVLVDGDLRVRPECR